MAIENVKCPICEGPMASRNSKYGTFWGCKAYPKCIGTRDSMGRSKEERDAERESFESGRSDVEVEQSAVDRISENDKFRFRKS